MLFKLGCSWVYHLSLFFMHCDSCSAQVLDHIQFFLAASAPQDGMPFLQSATSQCIFSTITMAKLESSDLGVQTMQSLRWVDADGSLVLVCSTAQATTQVTTFRADKIIGRRASRAAGFSASPARPEPSTTRASAFSAQISTAAQSQQHCHVLRCGARVLGINCTGSNHGASAGCIQTGRFEVASGSKAESWQRGRGNQEVSGGLCCF